jgi:macrolide-specific efflux system membrane fusion protein
MEQVKVPAKEAGTLARLAVREGAKVEAGYELGTLESDREQVAVALARIDLQMAEEKAANDVEVRIARKTHDVARSELARALESVSRFPKSISQTELDRLKLAAERAELELEKAQRDQRLARLERDGKAKDLQSAELEVERRRIVAPLPGMVVQVLRQPGEWLAPGEPVLRIVRLDKLRVEAFLNAQRVGSELLGRTVTLEVELPEGRRESYAGEVVFVDPEIEPVTGQFRIWAEVSNRDGLLAPGRHGALVIVPAKGK